MFDIRLKPNDLRSILIVLVLLLFLANPIESLRCYICHTDDNEQCKLKECPADQAYDRCMTTIYKNPIDGKKYRKECALGPCHLRGLKHLNFANFRTDCDLSKQDDCVFCCAQDGCNKDSALLLSPSISPILIVSIGLIISFLSFGSDWLFSNFDLRNL